MPSYDFRCNACKKRFVLSYKKYAEYFNAVPACTHCGSQEVTRTITHVAIAKSESSRFGDMADDSAMADLENADPATLGRYMRRMSQDAGEDLGEEFNEVVDRLESGESPEDIEAKLPQLADPDAGGGDDFGAGLGGMDMGGDFGGLE